MVRGIVFNMVDFSKAPMRVKLCALDMCKHGREVVYATTITRAKTNVAYDVHAVDRVPM